MKKNYTINERNHIADKLNECGFPMEVNGKIKLAHLVGRKLEFPVAITTDKMFHCEINWKQAERLLKGITEKIIY